VIIRASKDEREGLDNEVSGGRHRLIRESPLAGKKSGTGQIGGRGETVTSQY
jgi:hypothetical protein